MHVAKIERRHGERLYTYWLLRAFRLRIFPIAGIRPVSISTGSTPTAV